MWTLSVDRVRHGSATDDASRAVLRHVRAVQHGVRSATAVPRWNAIRHDPGAMLSELRALRSGRLRVPNSGPLGVAMTLPGQCCPVCVVSDPCAGVRCDKMTCPSGTSLTTFPGKCCPVCTPNIVDASPGPCDQTGFAAYLQKQIVGLDARSCMVDGDCTTLPMVDACRSGCGTAVNTKSIMSIYAAVQQFASTYCTGCAPTPGTCGTGHPSCVNGQCTSTVLPL